MIVMGRVSAPFGVKGWVKVQPYTEKVDNLFRYPKWWLATGRGWDDLEVEEQAVHGDILLVRFAGMDDRDAAAALKGKEVAIPRQQLPVPEPGEYYWTDLIGLAVQNTQGQSLGRVERLFESGANPVLVVSGDRERLLPFVEPVVKRVDLDAATLLVEWELDY
jgi:16S rRNA processing protein RimM